MVKKYWNRLAQNFKPLESKPRYECTYPLRLRCITVNGNEEVGDEEKTLLCFEFVEIQERTYDVLHLTLEVGVFDV